MRNAKGPVYIWHWVLTIVGICAVFTVRSRMHRGVIEGQLSRPMGSGRDTRFVAIRYPRISEEGEAGAMSGALFARHMRMLKENGYSTIGLEQACDLYCSDRPLPEKAVLVLLEGFRDTYINAVPVLEGLGLNANLMVNVKAMRKKNHFFMSWHDLRKMRRHPLWGCGIRADGEGDLQYQLEYLRKHFAGIKVRGVMGPVALNDSASSGYGNVLFFSPRDGDGYNSIDTDPASVNVLRAEPREDPRKLGRLLMNIFTRAPRFEEEFTSETVRPNWISTCGDLAVRDGLLELRAKSSQSCADTWLTGVHDWCDVDLQAKFRLLGGRQFWAYLRFRNEENYIRLGYDGEHLCLQQRSAGSEVANLKAVKSNVDFSRFHDLRLVVRSRYAVAYLDGRNLFQRPLRIDDSLISGKVGFKIWDSSYGVACCQLAGASVQKLPSIALMDMSLRKTTSDCTKKISDFVSYVCPNDLMLSIPQATADADNHKAFRISVAYRGQLLIPTVVLEESDIGSADTDVLANELADLVESNGFDGLHLDCRNIDDNGVFTALTIMSAALRTNLPAKSTLILSVSPQCYKASGEVLGAVDLLAVQLQDGQLDLLGSIPRPFRLKTILRVRTSNPCAFIEDLVASRETGSEVDLVAKTMNILEDHELKGIALCEE